ncbi:hypothetical protein FZEAL_2737 [Fusarium zealandicum]|uniref:Uncharacterized protein n=1 Tax=Fusarium zealandicum TaxID=1053134 RepID=A0A8H4UQ34_9HYPO|nr:hypothetical protein FZEAL_2737 [Fusarium zealandicum]
MAPPNGNAKARRLGGSKLAQSSKPVVPAIPLPYVKRQAATAAARASAASVPTTSVAPSNPTQIPAATRPETKLTNGAAAADAEKDAPAAAPASPISSLASSSAAKSVLEVAKPTPDDHEETKNGGKNLVDHQDSSVTSVSEHSSTASEHKDTPKGPIITDRPDQPTTTPQAGTRASDKILRTGVVGKPNGVASRDDPRHRSGKAFRLMNKRRDAHDPDADQHSHSKLHSKSRPPPAVPPSRYQMPPSFQPANRQLGQATNGDMNRGPRPPIPNGPPMHQPHPSTSNSSIHFGTFQGSTSSSPAPLSGGIAPPPGMPIPDGRPPYMTHGANGFPPMMHYNADSVPASTFDNYGRPSMAYGPMDSYPPFGNSFGTSTPHSHHDSQASGHPDENGMYNQYPSGPVRNGMTGPADDSQSPNRPGTMFGGPDYPRMMPNAGPPPHLMSPVDDADGLVGHLQQQFGSPEFADCVLELRYSDERAPPVRIPGHRLLFARSAEVANAISKQASQHNPNVPSLPTVVLETKSKWIRSNSFYIAVQRLYGLPLFAIPPPPAGLKQGAVTDAGSIMERFDFALSYAASGHLLRWDPVTRRGCEMAMQLLTWQTVERALEFALEHHRDEGSHDVFKYGDGSKGILNEAVSFITSNLNPNFILDTSVPDSDSYSRLPFSPSPSSTATQRPSPPPIARGTSVHLGKGRRPQQITGIQFGDLSLAEGKTSPASDTSRASHQQRSPFSIVLSRVLLNLPFASLKMVLESAASNKNSGWPNAEFVYRAVKDTVAERERRRLRAVEAVRAGQVPGWETIQKQLSSPEPRYFGPWTALGWQEEFLPFGHSDSPALGRTWVPLVDRQNGAQAAYP